MSDVSVEQVKEFIKNMSLMDAAQLVKDLEEELGVSAAAPVAMMAGGVAAGGDAGGAEAKTEFDLVLEEAGGELSDIFKLQVYMVRREDWDAVDRITKEFLPDKGFINSAFLTELLNPDMLIEIEATAWIE